MGMVKGVSQPATDVFIVAPPSEASTTLARLFKVAVVMQALNLLGVALNPKSTSQTWWVNGAFVAVLLLAYLVHRSHRQRLSAAILSLGFWSVATFAVFRLGGMSSPALFVYIPVVATASLCWSLRAGVALTVASTLVVLTVAQLDALGALPVAPPVAAQRMWVVFTGSLLITAVVVATSFRDLVNVRNDLHRSARQFEIMALARTAENQERDQQQNLQREEFEKRLHNAERMDAIGRLAGSVAHDFNNLLTVIANSTALLERTVPDDVRTRFLLREINDATGRSAAMVKRLLTIGRSTSAQKVEVNLRDVLNEMRGILVSLCGRRVQVVIRDLATHHTVWADRVQLEQAILNLVVNARDAMPDGGELFIGLENADTEANSLETEPRLLPGNAWPGELAQVPSSVRLVVRDQGVGMDERTLQRIFEPFYTTKGSGGGTGLGLATVQSAVFDSGGNIKVDSVPGQGTCFEITFPVLTQLSSSEKEGEDGSAQVSAVVSVAVERISGEVPRVDEQPAEGQEAVREHQLVSRSHEQGAARTRRSPQEE